MVRVINRIWDAIGNTSSSLVGPVTTTGKASSGQSSQVQGAQGLQGLPGATGPTGAAGGENLLVGKRDDWEFLVGDDGSILTDENGYALIGINSSDELLYGVDGNVVGPLSGV